MALKALMVPLDVARLIQTKIQEIGGDSYLSDPDDANTVSLLMLANRRQLDELRKLCAGESQLANQLANDLQNTLDTESGLRSFRAGKHVFDLSRKTHVMGILNVTPDSFSDGGKYLKADDAVNAGLRMQSDGADIIDIGGESTRPGAEPLGLPEELDRVIPVIRGIHERSDIPLSIDTYKSQVAEEALRNGAEVINDISGAFFDENMINTAAKYDASLILMHIKGKPQTMQQAPVYKNIIDEILLYLEKAIQNAMNAGIPLDKIMIDPGIGFGKQCEDNYFLIRNLEELSSLGIPILVGPSRKSFIGKLLNLDPSERLEGTLAAVACAIQNGAAMVRVHDVKEVVRAVKVVDAVLGKA